MGLCIYLDGIYFVKALEKCQNSSADILFWQAQESFCKSNHTRSFERNFSCTKMMLMLFQDAAGPSSYIDRQFKGSPDEYKELIGKTTTVYVGNVSFYTTEEQLYTFFGQAGPINKIIMGLDRIKKTPCGFCFVEFSSRDAAERSVRYLNRLKLDDQLIRVDLDYGFIEGRQFGRGRSGGQVRDEKRPDFDANRGGYGAIGAGGDFNKRPRYYFLL
eukprot:NODE_514_length_6598_cov_0.571011.p4 type:complete len:216 gc:universal NODE_514_length_6598_cov_0.571011:3068-2421(-)